MNVIAATVPCRVTVIRIGDKLKLSVGEYKVIAWEVSAAFLNDDKGALLIPMVVQGGRVVSVDQVIDSSKEDYIIEEY